MNTLEITKSESAMAEVAEADEYRQRQIEELKKLQADLATKRDEARLAEKTLHDAFNRLADYDGLGSTSEEMLSSVGGLKQQITDAEYPEDGDEAAPTPGPEVEAPQSDFLRRLLYWIIGSTTQKGCEFGIGRRAIAATWVLIPSSLDGKSLRKLAKEIGTSAPSLAVLTGSFSREFQIRTNAQSHASNYKQD